MTRQIRPILAMLVVALAASAALPGAAAAQHGNGLYEPFPRAAVAERAKRFVERLRAPRAAEKLRFSDEQLARGAFVEPRVTGLPAGAALGRTGAGAASARAGVESGGGSWLAAMVQVAGVLLAVVALAVLSRRRPSRRVAAV
jgi:hypothetical protein